MSYLAFCLGSRASGWPDLGRSADAWPATVFSAASSKRPSSDTSAEWSRGVRGSILRPALLGATP